jgi:hypothetical protein
MASVVDVVEEGLAALRHQLLNGLHELMPAQAITTAHIDMSVMLREREKTVAREERMLMRKQRNMEEQVEALRDQVQAQRQEIRRLRKKLDVQNKRV